MLSSLLVAAGLLTTTFATAHEVWIEDLPTGQLVVRFAEYGEDYEESPGNLDSLSLPEGWIATAEGANKVNVQKNKDHFSLDGAKADMTVQAETIFNVIGGKPGGKGDQAGPSRRPFFYARWYAFGTTEAAKPGTNLDIVPTGKPGEVCVYFRGKPIADIEVFAHTPDGKQHSFKSDKAGLVTVPVDQPGFYMLNCKRYREIIDGFSGGKPYTAVSHNCSVAWRQPKK